MQNVKSTSCDTLVVATSRAHADAPTGGISRTRRLQTAEGKPLAASSGRVATPARQATALEFKRVTVVGRGSNLRVAMAYLFEADHLQSLATSVDIWA